MEPLFSDDLILEKSKVWSEVMKDFCEKETFKEVDFSNIITEAEENSDDDAPDETIISNNNKNEPNDDENKNKCRALVKVDNYEGNTSSDDFEECANQTMHLVKEHRERWEKFGMVKVLETFDWDQISKVVAPWVEQNKLDKTQLSTSVDEHIVHIEEHHHRQVRLSSDDDSLDTASYIRSSRKKKHTSCTTTTIKKFSYVKGSKRHLQKKYGFDLDKDLDKIFRQRYPENADAIEHRGLKAIAGPGTGPGPGPEKKRKSFNLTPPARQHPIEHEPWSLPAKRRRTRQMKRRSDISKRSVSSSSSSSGSPARPVKPKFKRLSKPKSEDVSKVEEVPRPAQKKPEKVKLTIPKRLVPVAQLVKLEAEIDLTKLESSDSEQQESNQKSENSLTTQPKPLTASCQGATSSNETGFLGASIINSTALCTNNPPSAPVPIRKCQITPIKNKPEPQIQAQPAKKQSTAKLTRAKAKQLQELEKLDPKKPECKKPEPKEPEPKEPEPKEPEPKELEPKEPKPKEPELKEPEPKEPELKEPKPKEPKLKEPEFNEPSKTPIPEDTSKILLFAPTDLEPHRKNLSGKRFYLTQDYFVEKVGKKDSRRFIRLNSKKFPFVFDCSSTISFKVPDESEESASSDEDILYIFGREGKLLVETEEQGNDNKKE